VKDPIVIPVAGPKDAPVAQTVDQINAAARVRLLAHLGLCVRNRAIRLEKERLYELEKNGIKRERLLNNAFKVSGIHLY